MLYPREDRANNRLLFGCRNCSFVEEAASQCVFRNVLSSAAEETAGVTTDVGSDPTASNILIRLDCITTIKLTPSQYKASKYYQVDLKEAKRRRKYGDPLGEYEIGAVGEIYSDEMRPTRNNILRKRREEKMMRDLIEAQNAVNAIGGGGSSSGGVSLDELEFLGSNVIGTPQQSSPPPQLPSVLEAKRSHLRMLPRHRQSGAQPAGPSSAPKGQENENRLPSQDPPRY
ncbi:hypothetical protein ABW20_dc0110056 [Dactylellina cionopaga]|nr:hypothetical protein ABW20_dc0110056 [Dactylellina cionopaga]